MALLFENVLKYSIKNNASDIHVKAGYKPFLRIEGILQPLNTNPLTEEQATNVMKELLPEHKQRELMENGNTDSSFEFLNDNQKYRFRVNCFKEKNGYSTVLRVIPKKILDVTEIGFPYEVWENIIALQKGLVLVTGITGSGKTTTLASLVQKINENQANHIITLEDPIEYVYEPKKSIISQREIGTDLKTFGDGVKYSLRQDPDIILIGEIRDRETAEKALEAAATGHLVLSTLHTTGTAETVRRYVNLFPMEDHENIRNSLTSNLAYILSQQLIPYKKGKGRTLAMEVLNVGESSAVQNHLREGKYNQLISDIEVGARLKMISMGKHLEQLVQEDKITPEDAKTYNPDRNGLK